jgi:hypothetical protein
MWIGLLVNGKSLELRLGGATRGKWRIPDGKDESGFFSCWLGLEEQALIMY